MKGNIYGLDLKLTQIGQKIIPALIELNGTDSGTDSFRYDEGFRYYEKFVRILGAQARGKPILIEGWTKRAYDPLEKTVKKIQLERTFEMYKRESQRLASFFEGQFEFDYSWLDDLHRFKIAKLDETFDDTESRFYAYAAKKAGVPLFVYTDITYHQSYLVFDLLDSRKLVLKPNDIGIIRPRTDTLYVAPSVYKHLFLNSPLIEAIMESKPLTYFLSNTFSDDLYQAFPFSFPFGFGVNNIKDLIRFMQLIPSDLVVRKRGGSYCGTGVEMLDKQKIISDLKSKTVKPIPPAKVQALLYFIKDNVINGWRLEEMVSMYEHFVPSIPLYNPKTGKYHDGCARVMVYSPPGEKPIVLGSQWRLSTHHMKDTEATLEDKFRVNLSRGATAMKINPEHEAIMHDFAVGIVQRFENAVQEFRATLAPVSKQFKESRYNITETDIFRLAFWTTSLWHRMEEINAFNEKEEIINLPGFKEELENLPILANKRRGLVYSGDAL